MAWAGRRREACGLVGFDVLAAEENISWLGFRIFFIGLKTVKKSKDH